MKKKIVIVALAFAMTLSLVGLGSQQVSAKDETETITVGISPDYKPYESLTKKNKMVGFDIDMVSHFQKYLSEEEGHTVKFKYKKMDFDNIITQINGGQVDVGISGFTYSKKRKVEWSDPYTKTGQVAVVAADSDMSSVDDLKDKKLVAQTGSTGEEAAKEQSSDTTGLKDVQDIMNAIKANQYDAAVVDSAVAKEYASSGEYKVLDGSLKDEKNYIVAKKGNKKMIKKINKAIKEFKSSDDYQKLCDKYGVLPLDD